MATPQILSVTRAFRILSSFDSARGRTTISEIAERVGMNYKTVHRFLLTLEELGAVTRVGRSDFTLGVLLTDLGHKVSLNRALWTAAMPALEELVDEFGESVQVAILHNGEAMSVAHLPGSRPSARGLHIGQRVPLHCTAVGKVLAAGMDGEKIESLAKLLRFTQRTVNTIATRSEFMQGLAQIRKQGFAINDEEWLPGLRAIAVPIQGRARNVLAALSISGPANRMTRPMLNALPAHLTKSAERIARALYTKSDDAKPRRGS